MSVFADNISERGEEGREAPVADGQAGRKDHKREGQGGGGSKVKKKYFLLCETVVLLQEQLFAFCYVSLLNDSENKIYRKEKSTCNLIWQENISQFLFSKRQKNFIGIASRSSTKAKSCAVHYSKFIFD